jgi:hypothetical protein
MGLGFLGGAVLIRERETVDGVERRRGEQACSPCSIWCSSPTWKGRERGVLVPIEVSGFGPEMDLATVREERELGQVAKWAAG